MERKGHHESANGNTSEPRYGRIPMPPPSRLGSVEHNIRLSFVSFIQFDTVVFIAFPLCIQCQFALKREAYKHIVSFYICH